MQEEDLEHRFRHHILLDGDTKAKLQVCRTDLLSVAKTINKLAPEGQEKSLALTKLEEAMFWTGAAIVRNQDGN